MKKLYTLKKNLSILLLLSGLTMFSQDYTDGIFVLNEGGAGSDGASVSFIKNNTVVNNVFASANPGATTLGDTGQSIGFNGDYAYIVLNISNEIKVVDRVTFALVATISTGLDNPRYIAFSNGKGFITNWGDGGSATDDYVAVLNLANNTIISNIPVVEGVERILETNGKLYAAHMGGYGYGNSVTVINPVTETVIQNITVGDVPNSMVVKEGFLYVLCGGNPYWAPVETFGSLVKINLTDNSVVSTIPFPSAHPQNLRAGEGNNVYYSIEEDIFVKDVTNDTLPATPLFSTTPQGTYGIYGMDVIDGKIYLADAVDYSSPGHVYIYSTEGSLLEDYTVGVIPNSFYKSAESELSTIDQPIALNISVAPNPTSDVFYINTDKAAKIRLYDIQGRLVKDETYSTIGINVTGIDKGVYIVEITSENIRSTQRITIQ